MHKNQKTLKLNRDTVRNLDQGILVQDRRGGRTEPAHYTLCGTDVVGYYGKSH